MKTIHHVVLILSILLFIPFFSRADLRVVLKLSPVSAIQFETINAYVSVLNDSDREFILDESDRENKAHAVFIVERKRDDIVKRIDDRPPVKKLVIASGAKQDFISDVSLLYDLGTTGRYVVKAAIEVGNIRYESNPVVLDIVRGIELASVSRSVPGYPDRVRRYILRYWTREKREFIFLCVDEDDGKTSYGVFLLGGLIRVNKPTINVDRKGNVKVIHQTNRDCFIWSEFESNQDGVFFIDQSYHGVDGKPYQFLKEPSPSPK
ncbi:MAG: hypothetical protein PHR77_03020 [Kiritimatiellae bacterium]|nr:hypothetical protein [Kiritimatiellia bacterium]MDD5521037.1 hypothetical protein [Kiritimatiellia bacterium]